MSFPSLEEYTDNLINTCARYNDIPYIVVDGNEKFKFATHWIPRHDERFNDGDYRHIYITLDNLYRLYYDKFDEETVIIDDSPNLSVMYLLHKGDFVVLKGSKWNRYVKHIYMEEYKQTDEYRKMMKSSMEFARRAEMED